MPLETLPNGTKIVAGATGDGGMALNDNFRLLDGALAAISQNPPGMARLVSVKPSGNVGLTVRTSTGYCATRRWDGTIAVVGSGTPSSSITVNLAIPASGAWSKSAPKEIYVWSCASGDATQNGDLTVLTCGANLTTLEVSGLTALTFLNVGGNNLTALEVSGLTALTFLNVGGNNLTALDVSGLIALTSLSCYSNNLTTLDVSGLIALTSLSCSSNNLTTLDVSGLIALTALNCSENNLTSLRAVGVALSYVYFHHYPGTYIHSNELDAAALDQFYTDLAPAGGMIDVSDNPGTTGDDPTIATVKGYTIVGT